MSAPLVAIVGVPNVGKSTLFNRLVGSRRAIVTDEPGATRDRIYGLVRAATVPFRIVDTGGLVPGGGGVPLAREMEMQVERAMREAAVVLLVVDARSGLTAADRDVAILLRRRGLARPRCPPAASRSIIGPSGPGLHPYARAASKNGKS